MKKSILVLLAAGSIIFSFTACEQTQSRASVDLVSSVDESLSSIKQNDSDASTSNPNFITYEEACNRIRRSFSANNMENNVDVEDLENGKILIASYYIDLNVNGVLDNYESWDISKKQSVREEIDWDNVISSVIVVNNDIIKNARLANIKRTMFLVSQKGDSSLLYLGFDDDEMRYDFLSHK